MRETVKLVGFKPVDLDRALSAAQDFMADWSDRFGARHGVRYRFGAMSVYVYRTKTCVTVQNTTKHGNAI